MLNPIFTTLEQIQTTNICNSKTASHASSLLLSISQCSFILGLLLASDVLKQLDNLSKYLQTSNIEFNEAFTYIDSIIKRIQSKTSIFSITQLLSVLKVLNFSFLAHPFFLKLTTKNLGLYFDNNLIF